MRKLLCAIAIAGSAACNWPRILEPDLGLNLTAAQVTVEDQNGQAVSGVRVIFNDWTASGSTFTVSATTNQRGEVTFVFASPGQRRCEIQLPAGVSAGPPGLTQTVEIVAEQTARVRFSVFR